MMRALCRGGRDGAARGPVNRGVFLRKVVRASEQSALSSACPGLVSGCVDLFGWLFVVQCEAIVPRL